MASKRELKDLKKGLKRIEEKCRTSFNYLYNERDDHNLKLEALREENEKRKKEIAALKKTIAKLKKGDCKCHSSKT